MEGDEPVKEPAADAPPSYRPEGEPWWQALGWTPVSFITIQGDNGPFEMPVLRGEDLDTLEW